jgi:hypothetical protein
MRPGAVIAGCGWKLGRPFADRLDVVIRQAVLAALAESGLSIDDIDSFITVAGDTLDGISVPGRAEVAGNYGRRYLNVPSSAGHGLGAAVTQIEAGEAKNLILVGWGAATKYATFDPRRNQADPFYARPIGASPCVVAALQANEILDMSGMEESTLQSYADEMALRTWDGTVAPVAGAAPAWVRTGFCDGAVAIVLRRAGDGSPGVAVSDFASVSRAYSPEDERLDTAEWVKEAISAMSGPGHTDGAEFTVIEAAAPTPIAEARALSALGFASDSDQGKFNPSGGGATAHFGQATALRQIAETSRRLAAGSKRSSRRPSKGLVLDLTGPAGQHTTAIMLQAEVVQ